MTEGEPITDIKPERVVTSEYAMAYGDYVKALPMSIRGASIFDPKRAGTVGGMVREFARDTNFGRRLFEADLEFAQIALFVRGNINSTRDEQVELAVNSYRTMTRKLKGEERFS